MNTIPQTFEEWRACIVNDCKIHLTKEFSAERLAVYQDRQNPETKNFIALYGGTHLENVITWYQQV